ncbi:MAG: heavy metal translocating P-type ATPase metal-binding domain-containing protein [Bacteroidota bacterium]
MNSIEEHVDEKIAVDAEVACYHCGQPCRDTVWQDDKPFCCTGCETVYAILSENNLCDYYSMDKAPGVPWVIQKNPPIISWMNPRSAGKSSSLILLLLHGYFSIFPPFTASPVSGCWKTFIRSTPACSKQK